MKFAFNDYRSVTNRVYNMGIIERKEREKEQRRAHIVNAARDVFFERGLQNATMEEIAERAELSKGTLYLYFHSKEDLYLAVMMEGLGVLYRQFVKAIEGCSDSVQALRKLADVYLDFYDTHTSFFRMFYFFQSPQLHKQVSEEMLQECSIQNMKLWNFVIDVIKRGKASREIRDDLTSEETALMLWSMISGLIMRIDNAQEYWQSQFKLDLRSSLHKSVDFMLKSISTSP